MKFDTVIEESKIGKAVAGISLVIALLAGHKVEVENISAAHKIIKTELSQEIRDIIPTSKSKAARQHATRAWSDIIQQAKEENPELENVPDLYKAGVAIIQNPSLLD